MPRQLLPPTLADVRRAAMDLLARREHGCAELKLKLQRRLKGRSEPETTASLIEAVLVQLTDEGLLSEARFSRSVVRQCLSRGLGPLRIDQELRSKGIAGSWRDYRDDDGADIDWYALAESVYQKKFGDQALPVERNDRLKARAKRARFMQSRGFESDHYRALFESMQ